MLERSIVSLMYSSCGVDFFFFLFCFQCGEFNDVDREIGTAIVNKSR